MIDMAARHIKAELSLNDAQNAKLQDLAAAAKDLMQKHAEAQDPVRAQMEALLSAPTLDTDQVRALIHDREAAFQKDFDAALDTLLPKLAAFTDLLTPDQKKKVISFMDKMGQRWDRR
jgi:Spy/CpxP family protein refolding chaperone